jgi:hypothetical protein
VRASAMAVISPSPHPALVSKLLGPADNRERTASTRRIETLICEIASEIRGARKKQVVLGSHTGSRALSVGAPERAPQDAAGHPWGSPACLLRPMGMLSWLRAEHGAPCEVLMWRADAGGRVNSGLVPLEVIKAKAALHVSDWDLDDVSDIPPNNIYL